MAEPHVYFLRPVGCEGPVKIGTSVWPWGRLKTMAAWSPVPLELVAMTPGGALLEQRFHVHFRHLHSHGEWFHGAPELTGAVAAIAAGAFDFASLPPPSRLPTQCRWTDEARMDVSDAHRVRWMKSWGFPIPVAVSDALGGRYQPDPDELVEKRRIVRDFVEAHYEHVKAERSAASARKKAA